MVSRCDQSFSKVAPRNKVVGQLEKPEYQDCFSNKNSNSPRPCCRRGSTSWGSSRPTPLPRPPAPGCRNRRSVESGLSRTFPERINVMSFFVSSSYNPLSSDWLFSHSFLCRLASWLELGTQVGSTTNHCWLLPIQQDVPPLATPGDGGAQICHCCPHSNNLI